MSSGVWQVGKAHYNHRNTQSRPRVGRLPCANMQLTGPCNSTAVKSQNNPGGYRRQIVYLPIVFARSVISILFHYQAVLSQSPSTSLSSSIYRSMWPFSDHRGCACSPCRASTQLLPLARQLVSLNKRLRLSYARCSFSWFAVKTM